MTTLISHQSVLDFIKFLRYDVNDTGANILCLQGCIPAAGGITLRPNVINMYNDTIIVAHQTAKGPRYNTYLGTVDPGADPLYVNNPLGQAHLTFGQHMYVPGLHHGKPALRAEGEMNRVWRDPDKNHVISQGDKVHTGSFGVNIHAGGTGEVIGNWSAGCINIQGGWKGTQWESFIKTMNAHFKSNKRVGVTIWNASDFAKFVDGKLAKPTLRFGILGPWVSELQIKLVSGGYLPAGTVIDGDFQWGTDKAVRAAQSKHQLTEDGIVGANTWAVLG